MRQTPTWKERNLPAESRQKENRAGGPHRQNETCEDGNRRASSRAPFNNKRDKVHQSAVKCVVCRVDMVRDKSSAVDQKNK